MKTGRSDDSPRTAQGPPLSIAFMNSIPANTWRGGEKWMVNAAAGLADRGHRVMCIGREEAVWLRKSSARGLTAVGLPIHADFDPRIIARLYALFRKRAVDILCCNFEKDVRLGGIAGRLSGVKRIFTRKGLALMYDKARYRMAYRYIVNDIITPAAFIKERFSRFRWLDQDRIHVIPNGVEMPDISRYDRSTLRVAAGIAEGDPVILGAGEIFSQKGFEYLVDAVALLHGRGMAVHAAVAGGGDEEVVRARARRLGIAPYIHPLGHRDDCLELMYGADVFVLSSVDEGLPNVVLEAMSVGAPVVAANAGGTAEIMTDGVDGFIVPVKDAAALAAAIAPLLGDASLRKTVGETGRKTVATRFSIPVMVERIEELFFRSIKT